MIVHACLSSVCSHCVNVYTCVFVSFQEAEVLARQDKLRLLKTHKLTLVVDLDQTLIHTSTDPHIEPGLHVSKGGV